MGLISPHGGGGLARGAPGGVLAPHTCRHPKEEECEHSSVPVARKAPDDDDTAIAQLLRILISELAV